MRYFFVIPKAETHMLFLYCSIGNLAEIST